MARVAKWPAGALPRGTRVRFTRNGYRASEPSDLCHITEERYGADDFGVIVEAHPNQRADGCRDWVFVEVDSKIGKPRKLWVGVAPTMIEPAE